MAAQWFCKISGEEHGPLTGPQLVQLRQANRLRPQDLVRKGNSDWVPAISVIGLFPHTEAEQELADTAGSVAEATASSDASGSAEIGETHDSTVFHPEPQGEATPGGTAIARGIVAGARVGNYEILETIGQGGMGVVLKARHMRMERLVALKVLKSKAVQSPTTVHRFHQEVRAAAKLTHPNIVTAYDADEVDGVHFLVMEYVNGSSLAELLASRGRLEVTESLGYMMQVARGLEYAHSEGIVHRDIKPGNLLLDKKGMVKILDMGLASIKKTAEETAQPQQHGGEFVTQENQLLGTFDYMAPEQAEDAHSVDHRADIYSLGCTLYRLISGRLPYAGDTAIKKILAHRESPIPSIQKLRPDAPAAVDVVLKRMLAKSPADRQQSMTDVIADLAACLEGKARFSKAKESDESSDDTFRLAGESGSSGSSGSTILRANESTVYIPIPDDDEDLKGPNRGKFDMVKPVDNDRFYWQVMGQQTGPFSLDQLRARKIPPDDLVRSVYSPDWTRADQIEGLF